ncbi:sensor histidine kinase [Saccharopolyspora hattusasensis]|uniref:sensor histidine kinase n=1 Tax=Saccharopolyspora hattusasensis TaxID=1128679 RepID=UPI003D99243E
MHGRGCADPMGIPCDERQVLYLVSPCVTHDLKPSVLGRKRGRYHPVHERFGALPIADEIIDGDQNQVVLSGEALQLGDTRHRAGLFAAPEPFIGHSPGPLSCPVSVSPVKAWLFPWSWWWTLFDFAIVACVGTVAFQYLRPSPVGGVIGLAMAGVLVLRRHRPVLVMTLVSVLAVAQLLFTDIAPAGFEVALLVAMASVVTHAESHWHGYVAGVVATVGLVALLGPNASKDPIAFCILLGGCAVSWLIAYVLRVRKETAQLYSDRAATAERERDHLAKLASADAELAAADERAAIARELHDVVAHSLAVMVIQADGASCVVDKDWEKAQKAMRTVADTGRDALEDMHSIVAVLRGTATTGEEPDRRRPGLDRLQVLVERASAAGLAAELHTDGDPGELSEAEKLTLLRLVQESLTNVLRHSGTGAAVTVDLTFRAETVEVAVVDDGAGKPATQRETTSGGNGLIGMRERVAQHDGEFTAGPRTDENPGWQVRVVLPRKALAR